MATFAQLKANLQAALNKGNAKTGANDTSITACIDRLVASSGTGPADPTEGLAYTLREGGLTYQCDGIGTATGTELVIGGAYNGYPVTAIQESAFNNVQTYTKLTILDTITSIPRLAFGSTKATEVRLSCMLMSIGAWSFAYAPFTEVTIPPLVATVDSRAFTNCTALKKVTFKGIPTTIIAEAFQGCTALADIYVPWAEGAVASAPWGAPDTVTIHYNS